jgi:hypothetical protein
MNCLTNLLPGCTDQAPNMPPPPQYSQSNDEEPYYILKTNNPFLFWEPLSCNVFYVIYSLLLFIGNHVSRDDVSHVTGSYVIIGSDVIFPSFFLTIVVIQNVPLLFVIRFMASDYSFGIFWSLWWHVRGLISTWLFWGPVGHHHLGKLCYRKWLHQKWRHCKSRDRRWHHRKWRHFPVLFSNTKCPIVVCHSIYGFWLFLWYLLVIVLFVIRFTASDYSFGIFWSLCCLRDRRWHHRKWRHFPVLFSYYGSSTKCPLIRKTRGY